MRRAVAAVLSAVIAGGCAGMAATPAPSGTGPVQTAPVPPTLNASAPAPRVTYDSSICRMGSCGSATLTPAAAMPGATVRIHADNGYFGLWTADEWATWCGELPSITVHALDDGPIGSQQPGPNGRYPGVRAKLTIVDADDATFSVPQVPAASYRPRLSCGGDEAFAWPSLPELFTVLAGPASN